MSVLKMTDLNLAGKRVLIRQDLNVPIRDGRISSDKRLQASLPTLKQALEAGAKVMVMSHLGRPEEGVYDAQFSLRPIADYLHQHLQVPVDFVEHDATPPPAQAGRLMLLENVRFNKGEKKNEDALAQRMAALCDIYVMDAFGTAHRAQASTHGVAKYAPAACAGPLLWAELEALSKALENPRRPMVAIVGGAKVSSKLTILEALSEKVDQLIVGGGIANTFIAAAGYTVGKSLYEVELIETARSLSAQAQARGAEIPVPTDVVCGKAFSADTAAQLKRVNAVAEDDMIFDIGPETAETFVRLIHEAGTIIWNGPVGVFEFAQFGEGTRALAHAIAESAAFSIAGGGDTLAAVEKYGIEDKLSYISTGGGAFLEFLEGKELPAVEMLKHRAQALKEQAQLKE